MISLGIQNFIKNQRAFYKGQRFGLLCNHASLCDFVHSKDLIEETFPGQLKALFSPQHGFLAEKQDNMIESKHGREPDAGIPLYSLYGETRKPTVAMFGDIDTLLVDLVDVGTRVYTFMSTLAYCLEVAGETGKQVVVLDRPNPIGGEAVEGNVLDSGCTSFVGLYPLPMRHGMTLAELALYINDQLESPAELKCVPMIGWQRNMLFDQLHIPWVYPSPNMPHFSTALVYPGQVIWEGTNISEGRGTALPFEICGAPYINPHELLDTIKDIPLPGCFLRPVGFEPTSNKWSNEMCQGVQIHVTHAKDFLPVRTTLALLQGVVQLYPDHFQTKEPPYEYEFERNPIDLIIGDKQLRHRLFEGADLLTMEEEWQEGLQQFVGARKHYLLYE